MDFGLLAEAEDGCYFARMKQKNHRTVKPKTPWGAVVSAVLVGVLLLAGIVLSVWWSGQGIVDARLRGVVVSKEFVPQKEEQITIGEQGLRTSERDGEYIVTVEVPMKEGGVEPYKVWLDKTRYDTVTVGESFDVGPYLVK
ncbi:MAG: hypothetical protein WA771_10290 [Chthoniobacterales bacterium]